MVVVEVQRTAGCSYSFREACRAVLRSAKGLQPIEPQKRRYTIPSALPSRTTEILQQCVHDDYQIAYNMLQSGRSDSQELALDSLEHMTRSCEAKDVAAKIVLSCDCLTQLTTLLQAEEGFQSSVLRRKVLAVIANACLALNPVDLAETVSSNESLKDRSFVSMLLSALEDATDRPHDAYQAARCLQSLLVCKDVESIMLEMSAVEVVEFARTAGSSSHNALAEEAQKLMTKLRSVCM